MRCDRTRTHLPCHEPALVGTSGSPTTAGSRPAREGWFPKPCALRRPERRATTRPAAAASSFHGCGSRCRLLPPLPAAPLLRTGQPLSQPLGGHRQLSKLWMAPVQPRRGQQEGSAQWRLRPPAQLLAQAPRLPAPLVPSAGAARLSPCRLQQQLLPRQLLAPSAAC